jgi:hypothetical protein
MMIWPKITFFVGSMLLTLTIVDGDIYGQEPEVPSPMDDEVVAAPPPADDLAAPPTADDLAAPPTEGDEPTVLPTSEEPDDGDSSFACEDDIDLDLDCKIVITSQPDLGSPSENQCQNLERLPTVPEPCAVELTLDEISAVGNESDLEIDVPNLEPPECWNLCSDLEFDSALANLSPDGENSLLAEDSPEDPPPPTLSAPPASLDLYMQFTMGTEKADQIVQMMFQRAEFLANEGAGNATIEKGFAKLSWEIENKVGIYPQLMGQYSNSLLPILNGAITWTPINDAKVRLVLGIPSVSVNAVNSFGLMLLKMPLRDGNGGPFIQRLKTRIRVGIAQRVLGWKGRRGKIRSKAIQIMDQLQREFEAQIESTIRTRIASFDKDDDIIVRRTSDVKSRLWLFRYLGEGEQTSREVFVGPTTQKKYIKIIDGAEISQVQSFLNVGNAIYNWVDSWLSP